MTSTEATPTSTTSTTGPTEVRPFRFAVPDAALADLQARLDAWRRPHAVPGTAGERGVTQERLESLVEHWRSGYDWRLHEERLNGYPQYVVEIDGQPIHFLHVRSDAADATPLLVTHGYPSSVVEHLDLVDRLVAPEEGPAFHLVVPSVPGFGPSAPLTSPGWTMGRIARAWVVLMDLLGYDRYAVHGSDLGGGVSGMVAALDAEHVIGVHLATDPFTAARVATFIPGLAEGLDPEDAVDRVILERMDHFRREGSGYLALQNSRPQTLAYGLADSPVLQLAWIVEKLDEWSEHTSDADVVLTTASLYWFTDSGAGAAHVLYDQAHATEWGGPVVVPQAVAVFGADETVRRLVPVPEGARWTEHDRGQHFPALEAPDELAADLQAFFGPLS